VKLRQNKEKKQTKAKENTPGVGQPVHGMPTTDQDFDEVGKAVKLHAMAVSALERHEYDRTESFALLKM